MTSGQVNVGHTDGDAVSSAAATRANVNSNRVSPAPSGAGPGYRDHQRA